jgi:sugar/nucleoside kinase (ribokinase family)
MKPLPALVAGHICVDVIPRFDHLAPGAFLQLMQPGRLITAGPATFSTGGAVSNVGLSLHRLGVPTRLVARVGNDPFAQVVRDIVDSYDPGMSAGIAGSDTATSYTLILNPPGVDRIFLHHPGSNDAFGAGDVNYEMVADAALFHFGYPPMMQQLYRNGGAELVAMMRKVKETGATTSLDMVFPDPTAPGGQADWRSILAQTLPYVDIFVPSIEEMLFMLRRATYEQMQAEAAGGSLLDLVTPELLSDFAQEMLDYGVKIMAFKLGERGMYLRTAGADALRAIGRAAPAGADGWAERELWMPAFRVEVVGTTGAGDATIAGLLSGLLRGLNAEESVTAAVGVGACNVEGPDALSGVRSWEETLARIHAGWPRHPLHLDAPGWQWNEGHQLWSKAQS